LEQDEMIFMGVWRLMGKTVTGVSSGRPNSSLVGFHRTIVEDKEMSFQVLGHPIVEKADDAVRWIVAFAERCATRSTTLSLFTAKFILMLSLSFCGYSDFVVVPHI
jgi:hypothetical protein